MATLPSSDTTLDDAAGTFGSGSQVIAVCAPVPGIATVECAPFGGSKAILDEHGYCQGADYSALHIDETGLPLLFVAMPIATAGGISHVDVSGVTGTAVPTVTAGADGVLDQVDGEYEVLEGGTIGTDPIVIALTCDGGFNTRRVRVGTALTYTIPYLEIVLGFPTGKTLAAGDVVTFKSYGPVYDAGGVVAVRTTLAAQGVQVRSLLFIGDAAGETEADAVRSCAETYATSNDRFTKARCQARDRYRAASLCGYRGKTVGASLTFAEVGGTGDTITREEGSWITDGFSVGDTIVITGAVASSGVNNITAVIAALSATVITLGSEDLVAEGPITSATIVCHSTLTFAEVGATADTITRSSGSFVTDGFKAGMALTVEGSASNDFEDATIVTVSATVITLDTQDLVAEVVGAQALDVFTAEESATDWAADITEEHEDLTGDEARRLNIGAGYAAKTSPITGWRLRRPVSWAASLREYKRDVNIPTMRVADGPLAGWTLENAAGQVVEHDERVDASLLSGNFTCFRTWNNEDGAFIALDLQRADEGSLLSRSHNMDVANVACTTVQAATQREIGRVVLLQRGNGKAREDELVLLESRINAQLELALGDFGDGPRASSARWTASRDDVLNVPGAAITGTLRLELNGTIEHMRTRVAVPVAGA